MKKMTKLVLTMMLVTAPLMAAPPNILIIIADDLGSEHVAFNGSSPNPVSTPQLDNLAEQGLTLTNLWSAPICSPARAMLMTGRYAHVTGVGTNINRESDLPLHLDAVTLPEILKEAGYDTALIGKWHLGHQEEVGERSAPNNQGFDYYFGLHRGDNEVDDVYFRPKVTENGVFLGGIDQFLDDLLTEKALGWIGERQSPWFAVVAYYMPHFPFICPPAELHTEPCGDDRQNYRAMIEAHDTLVGELIAGVSEDTYVIWMSDNGSPAEQAVAPVDSDRSKFTVYQGGVIVPSIFRAPVVRQGVEPSHLTTASFLATIAEWAGAALGVEVEPSVADCLQDGVFCAGTNILTETYEENRSSWPPTSGEFAVRGDRYKIRAKRGEAPCMFDLITDPWENNCLGRNHNKSQWDVLMDDLRSIRENWIW